MFEKRGGLHGVVAAVSLYVRAGKALRMRTRIYWLSHWARAPYISETPAIIVGGSVRSGTTLMRTMLDSHPQIAAGPESWLFVYQANHELLAQEYSFGLEELEAMRGRSAGLSQFIDLFFGTYARRMGKARWAEKSPANVTRLKYIWTHFPRAKFIHMIRDGRDVVCSIQSQHKRLRTEGVPAASRTLSNRLKMWKSHVRTGMRWRSDERYFEVRYEDLIEAPRETMGAVLEFLGEPWSDDVMRAHSIQGNHPHIRKELGTPEVRQPIFGTSVGRWRKDLAEKDARYCWRKEGALLTALGYRDD